MRKSCFSRLVRRSFFTSLLLATAGMFIAASLPAAKTRGGPAGAATSTAASTQKLRLQLTAISKGINTDNAKNKEADRKIVELAAKLNIDLAAAAQLPIVHAGKDGKVFYAFCNVVANGFGSRQYMIQRIKKTVKTYRTPNDRNPQQTTTYLIEIFKLANGQFKRSDAHHGYYSIGNNARMEIIKELEVGFAELPGVATGDPWPFEANILYKQIHAYIADRGTYDKVTYTKSILWNFTVSLDAAGGYSVVCGELGIDVPKKPDPKL